ncbi:uncharacterized protein LOC128202018 [Galleria mellonella]|uniref:Uncharacterized protein LOC128202018 n=1 Tax=Galleria mellonella TaxID=7137 RepID=A0ABM3MZL6_GALME|nr:uncharacterized protein LOC128202018 [Galleria mellonella]
MTSTIDQQIRGIYLICKTLSATTRFRPFACQHCDRDIETTLVRCLRAVSMASWGLTPALIIIVLLSSASPAPVPRLSSRVTGITTGLEVPLDLMVGTGVGTGSIQLVINVRTDSNGNIEVYTN